jgi:hypothetical protein
MTDKNIKRIQDTEANIRTSLVDQKIAMSTDGENTLVGKNGSNLQHYLDYATWTSGGGFVLNNVGLKLGVDDTQTGISGAPTVTQALGQLQNEKLTAVAGTSTTGAGADANIKAENAKPGTDTDGGDLILNGGIGDGTGANGKVRIPDGLPGTDVSTTADDYANMDAAMADISLSWGQVTTGGFQEEHEFLIYEDTGEFYCEIWPTQQAWAIGDTYTQGESVHYLGFKYRSSENSNLGNQPDTSPDEWEVERAWDGNLSGYVDGSDHKFTLDCTTGAGTDGHARVLLTKGTSTVPVQNFVAASVLSDSARTLQLVNQVASPLQGPAIQAGYANVYAIGDMVIPQQRYTNCPFRDSRGSSMLDTMRDKLRILGAEWFQGVTPSLQITTLGGVKDSALIPTSIGFVFQLWIQTFPPNLSGTALDIVVLNDPITPFRKITDYNEITYDANGDTLEGNNTRYGIDIFGIINSGTNVISAIGVTLPTGTYSTDSGAINDTSNFSVTSVPDSYRFTSFRICRSVLKYQTTNGGTLINLVGGNDVQITLGSPLGGTGGSGVSGSTTNHNDLVGKQGGTIDEYFHLTSAEHSFIQGGTIATLDGNQTFTGTNTFDKSLTAKGEAEFISTIAGTTEFGTTFHTLKAGKGKLRFQSAKQVGGGGEAINLLSRVSADTSYSSLQFQAASGVPTWQIRQDVGDLIGYDTSGTEQFCFDVSTGSAIISGDLLLAGVYAQTTDPLNAGQLWNNSGVATFSDG